MRFRGREGARAQGSMDAWWHGCREARTQGSMDAREQGRVGGRDVEPRMDTDGTRDCTQRAQRFAAGILELRRVGARGGGIRTTDGHGRARKGFGEHAAGARSGCVEDIYRHGSGMQVPFFCENFDARRLKSAVPVFRTSSGSPTSPLEEGRGDARQICNVS